MDQIPQSKTDCPSAIGHRRSDREILHWHRGCQIAWYGRGQTLSSPQLLHFLSCKRKPWTICRPPARRADTPVHLPDRERALAALPVRFGQAPPLRPGPHPDGCARRCGRSNRRENPGSDRHQQRTIPRRYIVRSEHSCSRGRAGAPTADSRVRRTIAAIVVLLEAWNSLVTAGLQYIEFRSGYEARVVATRQFVHCCLKMRQSRMQKCLK